MSNTATDPAAEPFTGKDSGIDCPNCFHPLYSGLAEGGILVCRDEEGNGCQLAVDPNNLDGSTMATASTRMEDIEASPEVGPPNENAPSTEQDDQIVAAAHQPWEPPTSAPQAQNYDPDAVVEQPAVVPTPVVPKTPPKAADVPGDASITT